MGNRWSSLFLRPRPNSSQASGSHNPVPEAGLVEEQDRPPPNRQIVEDVLRIVFAQLIASIPELEARSRAVVRLTHVCPYWRAVAIDSPRLWTNVIGNPERCKAFLERSRDLPVSVIAGSGMAAILNPHMGHIERLVLRSLASPELSQYMWPAPVLKYLTVSSLFIEDDGMTRMPHMFSNQTPKLLSLSLIGVTSHWNSSLLNGLTHLELEGAHDGLSCRYLLEILGHNPELQTLRLSQMTWSIGGEDVWRRTEAVRLPRLRDLFLDRAQHLINRLLPFLDLPHTTVLRVGLSSPWDVFSSQPWPVHYPALHRVRHVQQTITGDQERLYRPTWTLTASCYTSSGGDHLVLQVEDVTLLDTSLVGWFPLAGKMCSLATLTSYAIHDPDGFLDADEPWSRLLGSMGSLETLRVFSGAGRDPEDQYGERRPRARLAPFAVLAADAQVCPALARLEFDSVGDDDEQFSSAVEALRERRPGLACVRLPPVEALTS